MAWVRIDDTAPEHPKLLAAGPEACWLWVAGLAYCNRNMTDGLIPTRALRGLGGVRCYNRAAKRLVDVNLWMPEGSIGFRVKDYLKYQPSRDQVECGKKSIRDRVARHRSKQKHTDTSDVTALHVTPQPNPTQPNPYRESDIVNKEQIEFGELELFGYSRFGQLGGSVVAKLRPFCPIAGWEWEAILNTEGSSWGYVVKVLQNIRAQQDKPRPNGAGPRPLSKWEREEQEMVEEFMRRTDPNRGEKNGHTR